MSADALAQNYPLWLAEVHEGVIRHGRIVGWQMERGVYVKFGHEGIEPTSPPSWPVVAFTADDGTFLGLEAASGGPSVLGDTAHDVVRMATQVLSYSYPCPDGHGLMAERPAGTKWRKWQCEEARCGYFRTETRI